MNALGYGYGMGYGHHRGMYGLGQDPNGNGMAPSAEAGAQFKAAYEGAITFGVPVVTGLVGVGVGVFLGWVMFR